MFKGTEESTREVDSSVPLTGHDPRAERHWIDLFSRETQNLSVFGFFRI